MTIDELNEFNKWRETIRMIYDSLHFSNHHVKRGIRPATMIVKLIEDRHPTYFGHRSEVVIETFTSSNTGKLP